MLYLHMVLYAIIQVVCAYIFAGSNEAISYHAPFASNKIGNAIRVAIQALTATPFPVSPETPRQVQLDIP